jgi:hypothetical protein
MLRLRPDGKSSARESFEASKMSGGMPAGSSRSARLDPFALPVRFSAIDAAADGRSREVELTRERVVVRRSLDGMRMAVNLPLSAYRGVAIRMLPPDGDGRATVAVVLEHKDPSLALELYVADDGDEVAAEWRTWGHVLGLPLLVAAEDGGLQEPFDRLGRLQIKDPTSRRRRRNAVKKRRPSILMRRKPTRLDAQISIYRGEREIIARN